MKIKVLLITVLLLAVAPCVSAEVNIDVFDSSGRANVTGVTADTKNSISAAVLGAGFSGADAENMVSGSVVYANQIKPAADGSFTLPLVLNGKPTGMYTILLYQNGSCIEDRKFPYADAAESVSAIEGFNAAAVNGAASALKYAEDNTAALEFWSRYDGEVSRRTAVDLMLSAAPYDTADKRAFGNAYRKAMAAAAFAEGKVTNIDEVRGQLDVLDSEPVAGVLDAKYMTDKAYAAIAGKLTSLAPYDGLDCFDKSAIEAVALSVIRYPSGSGDVASVISKLYPDFPLSKLTDSVCRNTAYKDYDSIEKFQKAVEDAAGRGGSGGSGAGSGSGGSGGSSSSGSGTPFTAVSDPSHMVQPPKEAEEKLFEDIDGFEWAETAITALYEKGIISGREPKRFCPESEITREEFVKLLVLLFKVKETDERDNTFSDCVEGEWYYPYIRTAYTVGIVNGISDTEFGVGQNITRQDAAVMIKNCMEKYDVQRNDAAEFSDMSEVSDYAKDAVRSMREYGIITGYEDNSFRPENYITRAEAAKLIFETDERIDEI